MPYIHVTVDELLSDVSDKELLKECKDRGLHLGGAGVAPMDSRGQWETWRSDVERAARAGEWTTLHLLLQEVAPPYVPPKSSLMEMPGLRQ